MEVGLRVWVGWVRAKKSAKEEQLCELELQMFCALSKVVKGYPKYESLYADYARLQLVSVGTSPL